MIPSTKIAVSRLLLLLLWFGSLLFGSGGAAAEPSEQRFVQELVTRRLFELAELQCRNLLADERLASRERAGWTVELIRILGQHAANSNATERPARWQAAHDVAREFLAAYGQHPRRELVEVQDALTLLAEGELARLESEVAADPEEALARARDTVRSATRQLEAIDKHLTEQIARAGGATRPADALSADELFSLQNNVRFQLARAFRNQALCYPGDSDDRVAALSLAVDRLNATLTQLQAGDTLAWQVYLNLAACYRLLDKVDQAQRMLTSPLEETAPVPVRLEAFSEQARLIIAAGHPQQALDELDRAARILRNSSPELDYAQLEAMLALCQAAADRKDAALAQQWQNKSVAAVDAMEQKHGTYWGRRAELALLAVVGKGIGNGDAEIIGRTADNLYKKGQLDEAITTYERAARKPARWAICRPS